MRVLNVGMGLVWEVDETPIQILKTLASFPDSDCVGRLQLAVATSVSHRGRENALLLKV